ncbi:MAG: S-adenosyl-l-methionine hydroxide adenosyltransferase family protein [Bacteroidales bacterium]
MPIVTLTTDWIQDDYYAGAIKGKLIASCPDINIVDISHKIPAFNTTKAAFILKNSFHHFPKGTIHMIFVNSEPSEDAPVLAINYEGHFFIGNDNGIFGLLFRDKPAAIVELTAPDVRNSFDSLEIFIDAACYIANNGDIGGLGTERENYKKSIPRRATIEQDVISGSVIYIDSYQNAITNITMELYERIGKGRPFEIALQSNHYKLYKINKTYCETSTGELLVLFNSLNLLEVAINKGNAAELLNLNTDSTVRIKFFEKKSDFRNN